MEFIFFEDSWNEGNETKKSSTDVPRVDKRSAGADSGEE